MQYLAAACLYSSMCLCLRRILWHANLMLFLSLTENKC